MLIMYAKIVVLELLLVQVQIPILVVQVDFSKLLYQLELQELDVVHVFLIVH